MVIKHCLFYLLVIWICLLTKNILAVEESNESFKVESEELKIDTAILTILFTKQNENHKGYAINILQLSENCYNCSYYSIDKINTRHHQNITATVDVRWPLTILVTANASNVYCAVSMTYHYKEYGKYVTNYTLPIQEENVTCSLSFPVEVQSHSNSFIAIYVLIGILIALSILYSVVVYVQAKWKTTSQLESSDSEVNNLLLDSGVSTDPPAQTTTSKTERIKSLDAFRGLSIIVMVFVNYKGGKYWFFHHSPWNGITVADLVFPWFMFIMGISMVMSIDSLVRKSVPTTQILYKIVRRTVILFAVGLVISNGNATWSTIRIPGVLQRFSITYLITAILQFVFHKTVDSIEKSDTEQTPWYCFRDITCYWKQWIIIAVMEVLWLCITFLLPVPGCPTGYIGPGGLSIEEKYVNCTGGAAAYIDKLVFGAEHLYSHPTCKELYFPSYSKYDKVPFDPEGLLGSINSCVIVFFGLQAGKIFLYYKSDLSRVRRFLIWCTALGAISAILSKCSQNDGWIPINKNLWSFSFVTTLSSMAFFIVAVFYYIIDVKQWWSGIPFHFVGMNSILVYVGHEIFGIYIPFYWGLTNYSTHANWLVMSSMGTFCWTLIAYYCYVIKFFVKI